MREKQFNENGPEVKEGIFLSFQRAAEAAIEYMRIRNKRTEEFWSYCKMRNDTSMREYADIRRLAREIHSSVYPRDRTKPRGKKQEERHQPAE